MNVLEVRDLRIAFGDSVAVADLSFDLPAGGALGIVGESGSGKTATALALLGLHRGTRAAVSGTVRLDGQELTALSNDDLRKVRGAGIAMVFQEPLSALSPFQTVGDQIAEVYRLHTGASRKAARLRAVEVLGRVHIPDPSGRASAYPHQFSGGMRQRALIAMALSCSPRVIVADEPTTALDVTVQAQILDLLDEVRAETGTALLLISHDLGVVAGSTDDVIVMRRGIAVESGPVDTVLVHPRHAYTRELLDAVAPSPRPARVTSDEPLLRVAGVTRTFPARRARPVTAVDDVTLDVRRGETLGLVGESGSGKTTLSRMMVGLVPPTRGRITFDGVDVARRRRHPSRHALQMVFQDPLASLNPRRTIGDSIADPLRLLAGGVGIRQTVEELLVQVGLRAADYDRYPHELSGGMRQRVGIARAVAPRPRLIVCDEPVTSLDATTRAQILRLLASLRESFDLTMVFVSHDLAVVRQVADRVAVMHEGAIVELGDTETVYERPEHPYTKALLNSALVVDPGEARLRRGRSRAEG
jgi:peptide/nickel transport system ATP-binding protein